MSLGHPMDLSHFSPPDPALLRAIFDGSPLGVVVLDAERHVLSVNPAAAGMVGEIPEGATCCRVFGCRRVGTALEGACLTLLALRASSLPEIRVELGPKDEPSSVWVTAASLPAARRLVIAHLRPGIAGDRRRRTEPHWRRGPRLKIQVLGRTIVESREAQLSGEWLGHRPGQLLKYLVLHRARVVPLEELIEVFWPDTVTGRATRNVRQAIHTLRDRLEPARGKHAASMFVASRTAGYQLETAYVDVDVDAFESGIEQGLAALGRGDAAAGERLLTNALALRRGDVLADEPYAEWALAERDRLRSLAARGFRALATSRLASADLEGATDAWLRLAELQPLDLDIQRELLRLLLEGGHHTEATRRVELVRRRYRASFGAEVDLDLAELLAEGRSGC